MINSSSVRVRYYKVKSGKKKIWIAAGSAALLLLLIAGATIRYFAAEAAEEAALPPEQRIKRNFDKAFDPDQSMLARLDNLRRSFSSAQQIPADKRHAAMVDAMAGAVNRTLQEFAALPPEQKQERARLLREDAEKTLAYFRRMPREKQEKALALLMSDEGGRAAFDNAVNTATNVLSPQDRELLGLTFKTWKKMLEKPR